MLHSEKVAFPHRGAARPLCDLQARQTDGKSSTQIVQYQAKGRKAKRSACSTRARPRDGSVEGGGKRERDTTTTIFSLPAAEMVMLFMRAFPAVQGSPDTYQIATCDASLAIMTDHQTTQQFAGQPRTATQADVSS